MKPSQTTVKPACSPARPPGGSLGRAKDPGQNLVELVLILPFLIILMVAIVEVGRGWQAYQGAKMAAMDGAYTASISQNPTLGLNQMKTRLDSASLSYNAADLSITPLNNGEEYQASVTIQHHPLFGGIALPALGGPITLVPEEVDIRYSDVKHYSTY